MDEIQILQLIILLCKEEKVSLPKIDEEITLFNYIVDTFIHKLETNSFKHSDVSLFLYWKLRNYRKI